MQPWIEVIAADRLIMGGIVVVMGFVWLNSNFAEKKAKQPKPQPQQQPRPAQQQAGAPLPPPTGQPVDPGTGTGAHIGRKAGRLVGNGINAAKRYGKR